MDNAAQILIAATKLFAAHGFGGTSLQAIGDAVGVTKQTLLYHYPSKEALRRAVLDGVFEHWRERLPRILEAFTSGYRRFEALTDELLRFFRSDPDRARLLLRESLDSPEDMRTLLAETLRPWVLLIAQYIREGQRAGTIYPDVDPEAYVLQVLLLAISTVACQDVVGAALGGPDYTSRAHAELSRLTHKALFVSRPTTKAGPAAKET
jgi:AcrR family transcriptional regulator